ncbi:hypothetical protein [Corynebacterium pygosceleis]|uniref:hypothetical protein n=1 Tax=Corynebacterium pygosceleis TaxID=2800406 RepID=UPI002002F223|nr:hypothetical protein [Corynebacterium pygosceleis]MCK7676213.1 hypothetical protein [Corynebacterium pygosceleis]
MSDSDAEGSEADFGTTSGPGSLSDGDIAEISDVFRKPVAWVEGVTIDGEEYSLEDIGKIFGAKQKPQDRSKAKDKTEKDLSESEVDRDETSVTDLMKRANEQVVARGEADNKRRDDLFKIVMMLLLLSVAAAVIVMICVLVSGVVTEVMVSTFFVSVAAQVIGLTAIIARHLFPADGHDPGGSLRTETKDGS